MLLDTHTYYHDLNDLASNNMNKWNAQEQILEKNRNAVILTIKNLVHFEQNNNGDVISVDDYEKPTYVMTENQLKILYEAEDNLLAILKKITEELLEISSNMQNNIVEKNDKNRKNLVILDSILRKREVS